MLATSVADAWRIRGACVADGRRMHGRLKFDCFLVFNHLKIGKAIPIGYRVLEIVGMRINIDQDLR
jgi:hypothetical protein